MKNILPPTPGFQGQKVLEARLHIHSLNLDRPKALKSYMIFWGHRQDLSRSVLRIYTDGTEEASNLSWREGEARKT